MTRAGVAQLKARLSAYLRRVQRGDEVVVMDRDTPESLRLRRPASLKRTEPPGGPSSVAPGGYSL